MSPKRSVIASATSAAEIAGPPCQTNGNVIISATTPQPAIEPAATPNTTVARPEQQIFERVGGDQLAPRRAERLEHDGVVDAVAVPRRERAAKHQHGGNKRHHAGALAPPARDSSRSPERVERLLDAYRRDGRKRVGHRLSSAISSAALPPPG